MSLAVSTPAATKTILIVDDDPSVTETFDEPGTYHYVCTLHSKDMEGEVVVR